MKGHSFKNSAVVEYSDKEIFKVFKKMIKQDFPRFNEKDPVGTSVKKKIGSYSTKSAEAYIEITDYKENEVYEITTVTSKTQTTFISRYTLTPVEDGKTLFTLEQSQAGDGFFVTLNHFIQSIFFKGRIKKRFSFLLQGLDNEITAMRERSNPKNKVDNEATKGELNEVATDICDDNFDIKEKENISE